ncbi:putative enzyme [Rhodococcus sp. RD6.2]|uniref:trehalose-phosphatase n=1 Tax=Rhodococcus sp. RD6.2 TaxID=260936 RepID=UPI00063B236E|nr:trehalose-phosphatase [Rhodococcus sp. RD6.2]CRK51215.1 putative enzyme [Rhodococcus sp. RD6.2]
MRDRVGETVMRPVVDLRRHGVVIFDLGAVVNSADGGRPPESAVALAERLRRSGVEYALISAHRNPPSPLGGDEIARAFPVRVEGSAPQDAVARLGSRLSTAVLVACNEDMVEGARQSGFALVIGVASIDNADALLQCGADVVVRDIGEIDIRAGDRRVADIPGAVTARHELAPPLRVRRPAVVLDFDGTLADIVSDPAAAALADGVAAALARLAADVTVAVISGRDLGDVRARVGVPGLWYAGGHGVDIVGPDGRRYENPGAFRAVNRDVNWDKGQALQWMLTHAIDSDTNLLLYVGDDLPDEDAFDVATAVGGVGIVVRSAEAADRRSAARYALDGPAQVRELLEQLADAVDRDPVDASRSTDWILHYDGYDPATEKLREAICTLGNGFFATRGCAPESEAGPRHYPGTYVAGIYNRLDETRSDMDVANESMVNAPNWLTTTFRVGESNWFDVDTADLLEYHQFLNIRRAVLTRRLRYRDTHDRVTTLVQRRFVAMHLPHVCALETTIIAENWSGTVELRSAINGAVHNSLVDRYRDLRSDHLERVEGTELSLDSVLLTAQTNQSHVPLATAARTTTWSAGKRYACQYRWLHSDGMVGHDITFDIAVGQAVTVEKAVTLFTGRDRAVSHPGDEAARWLSGLGRFDDLLAGHALMWEQLWDRVGIDVADHADASRILRLHQLHLLQTASPTTADLDVGVPARGLHGEAYRGHIFWDELFVFPVLNLREPALTRSLLHYRYRRLPEARRAARAAGFRGAMFPWQSGSDGREESQQLHLNPQSGRWLPDASWRQHHIGIAIAYNVWQYYQVTGDVEFLADIGAEMLVELARFFASLASYDRERCRFVIPGVMGPDEFHSGSPDDPYGGVDNNAYTNVMAVWVILRALEALDAVPAATRTLLVDTLHLDAQETTRWIEVSRGMFVPFHDRVISQFEGYGDLAELDWTGYRERYGDVRRLDRILEAEGDDVNRYRASKQADVLMLFYLLSADELRDLFDRLGYDLEPDDIPRTIDYYMARTSHGSTLSAVVHSWVLARANRHDALHYFDLVLSSDVADIQGGTTAEGIHLAAMAGGIDLLQRCFTGLETRCDQLVFGPHWPEELGALEFPICYRGHQLWLTVSGRQIEVSAAEGDQPPIEITCRDRVVELRPGGTVMLE